MSDKSLRRLPSILRGSFALTYAASPALFLLTLALDLIGGLSVAVQLLLARKVLDIFSSGQHGDQLRLAAPYLGALLLTTVLAALAQTVSTEQGHVQGELVTRHVFERILGVAERVELAAFESPEFFDRLQRAVMNGSGRPLQMTSGVTRLMTSGVTAAGIAAVVLRMAPILLPIGVVAYLPIWLVATRNSRFYYDYMHGVAGILRRRNYLQNVRQGRNEAKEIRAFDLAPMLRDRYDSLYDEYIGGLKMLARRRTVHSLIGISSNAVMMVAAIAVLGYLYVHGHINLATAGTSVAALVQLAGQMRGLLSGASSLYEGSLFLGDYSSFVEMNASLTDRDDREELKPTPTSFARISAEDVSFTYPGSAEPSVRGATVELRAGEIVALVGENGSGKTTLAKIIAGLYEPSSGRITWNGTDVRDLNGSLIRDSIAVIFQDFIKYFMSARENIGAGRWAEMDDIARVVEAARAANAGSFLNRLPDGFETLLGKEFDGGYDLSVGQWQRVALARAFFRGAPIVILDEPTSALDPRAEKELFDSVRSLLKDRTVLLISHRFSSVRTADRIYVLDRGQVKEAGTHSELMDAGGLYAELFTIQASAYLDDGESGSKGDAAQRR